MAAPPAHHALTRRSIGEAVRRLREARSWTQADLGDRLDITQSRLSLLERGQASFTAEQLLALMRLFNVDATYFDGEATTDPDLVLQNALARLGARHLREAAEVTPDARLSDVNAVLPAALVSGRPRLVAALAPVLVEQCDAAALPKVQRELAAAGLERRLPWLVENVLQAIERELEAGPPRPRAQRARRARLVLGGFHALMARQRAEWTRDAPLDVLDADVRSEETLAEVAEASSDPSRRWRIVTRLRPADFTDALEASHLGD
ncbi:MAG: helix-turn-helix transcriptional regulator [Myxococcales bacterium]|nr:helix-turn-helix transcriptional regulator [Myxococcales bacterium]